MLGPLLALSVWAIDDGEKIARDAPPPKENPVWSEGQPIRLIGMRNETVAFQVAVSAGDEALEGVTVDIGSIASVESKLDIERFVEHYFEVPRHSGGVRAGESLGWVKGSGPGPSEWVGWIPDALIPVEIAPAWDPYPMKIAPHQNGVIWVDVWIGRDRPPGTYRGDVVVKAGDRALATLPVELEVYDAILAERPVRTMLHYGKSELDRRIGPGHSEEQLLRLLHRHRIAPMHGITTLAELEAKLPYLDGSFYLHDYEGPGVGMGDGVLALGPYGTLGAPSAGKIAAIAPKIPDNVDAFIYAVDEDCKNPWGREWWNIAKKTDFRLRVGWTCSEDPRGQPVDIVIQLATFDARQSQDARMTGREVWTYNGLLPRTGSFLTDTAAISPRVNGWLEAMFERAFLGRWFYWESTFWYDDNKGGHGAYDPFVTAETFHNKDGDWAMGDGVLLYPGKQVEYPAHSLGFDGVIPSIRLKNWRRGIQDAGYLQMARIRNAKSADAIARKLIPKAFSETKDGDPVSWSRSGRAFFDARKELLALVPKGENGGTDDGSSPPLRGHSGDGCGCRGCQPNTKNDLGGIGLGAFGLFFFRRALRRSSRAPASSRTSPSRPLPPASRD